MFSLIKKQFILSLNFRISLVAKCLILNDEPGMVRPFIIDQNPAELKYYPFMVILDKCSGSCSSGNGLSMKLCVLSKSKDVNIKGFNMIYLKKRNEVKPLVKHI